MPKKISIIIIGIFLIGVGFYIGVIKNVDALYSIAAGLDKPSKSYYFVTERIYKICEKNNIGKKILGYLDEGKNKNLHNLYIQSLGIIGEKYAAVYLIKAYSDYQDDKNRRSTLYYIIDSMGLLGNNDFVPLLVRLLTNYDKHNMQITRYSIARALYLITGKRYNYVNSSGEKTRLNLTKELEDARRVIEESKNRPRTFEEMMILDRLSRPPGW